MERKGSKENTPMWYYKRLDGTVSNQLKLEDILALIATGEIDAQTQVSTNNKDWRLAVSEPKLGFECIVLEVGESLNVLGPFAREMMDNDTIISTVPKDGILFVRSGVMAECCSHALAGASGSALVERVVAAEKALRDSIKEKRAAEAALAAKDLEFDAERQKLNATISQMKADLMKRQSELDGLQADVEGLDSEKRLLVELEAKADEAQRELRAIQAERKQHEKSVQERIATLESELAQASVTNTEDKAQIETLKAALEVSQKVVAEQQANEAVLKTHVAQRDAEVNDMTARLARAEQQVGSVHETAEWLQEQLKSLADGISQRFSVPVAKLSASAGVISGGIEPEVVEVEVVEAEVVSTIPSRKRESATPARVAASARAHGSVQADAVDGVHQKKQALSALEDQLKREISSLGNSGLRSTNHDSLINNVFKRKK